MRLVCLTSIITTANCPLDWAISKLSFAFEFPNTNPEIPDRWAELNENYDMSAFLGAPALKYAPSEVIVANGAKHFNYEIADFPLVTLLIYRSDFPKPIEFAVQPSQISFEQTKESNPRHRLITLKVRDHPVRGVMAVRIRMIRCLKRALDNITELELESFRLYEKLAREICDAGNGDPDRQEEVAQQLCEKFQHSNLTDQKPLSNIISAFEEIVIGKKVPVESRCSYERFRTFERAYKKDQKYYNFLNSRQLVWCKSIHFWKMNLSTLPQKLCRAVNLTELSLVSVPLVNVDWEGFVNVVRCMPHLVMLTLSNCNLLQFPEALVEALSERFKWLDLSGNDLAVLPTNVGRLRHLSKLDVSNNAKLDDSAIPWEQLPSTVTALSLDGTKISKIPESVAKLSTIKTLSAANCERLTSVAWTSINAFAHHIYIGGSGKLNPVPPIPSGEHIETRTFSVCDAGWTDLDWRSIPSCTFSVSIGGCKFGDFPMLRFLGVYDVNFDNCEIERLNWFHVPHTVLKFRISNNLLTEVTFPGGDEVLVEKTTKQLHEKLKTTDFKIAQPQQLCLCRNRIQHLVNISFLTELRELDLSDNNLSELPEDFVRLRLAFLDLSYNNFGPSPSEGYVALKRKLWDRLPPTQTLNVTFNDLGELPCSLAELHCTDLIAENCKLVHICPKLNLKLKVSQNPKLTSLPFLPCKVCRIQRVRRRGIKTRTRSKFDWESIWRKDAKAELRIVSQPRQFRTEKALSSQSKSGFVFQRSPEPNKSVLGCSCCLVCEQSVPATDKQAGTVQVTVVMDCPLREHTQSRVVKFGSKQWKGVVFGLVCGECLHRQRRLPPTAVGGRKLKRNSNMTKTANFTQKRERIVLERESDGIVSAALTDHNEATLIPQTDFSSDTRVPFAASADDDTAVSQAFMVAPSVHNFQTTLNHFSGFESSMTETANTGFFYYAPVPMFPPTQTSAGFQTSTNSGAEPFFGHLVEEFVSQEGVFDASTYGTEQVVLEPEFFEGPYFPPSTAYAPAHALPPPPPQPVPVHSLATGDLPLSCFHDGSVCLEVRPPDTHWLVSARLALGLSPHSVWDVPFETFHLHTTSTPLRCVRVETDGHSGFRALSLLLTGSEEHFMALRNHVLAFVVEQQNRFARLQHNAVMLARHRHNVLPTAARKHNEMVAADMIALGAMLDCTVCTLTPQGICFYNATSLDNVQGEGRALAIAQDSPVLCVSNRSDDCHFEAVLATHC